MIVLKRYSDGIKLEGHANYAPHGCDIVCAGVSTLIQNLIQSIEELTDDKISYSMQSGKIDIEFGDLSERGQVLMDSFFIGLSMIAESYPNHVKIA